MKRALSLILILSNAGIVAESYQYYLDHANKPIPYAVLNPRSFFANPNADINNIVFLELAIKNYSTYVDSSPSVNLYSDLFTTNNLEEKKTKGLAFLMRAPLNSKLINF